VELFQERQVLVDTVIGNRPGTQDWAGVTEGGEVGDNLLFTVACCWALRDVA